MGRAALIVQVCEEWQRSLFPQEKTFWEVGGEGGGVGPRTNTLCPFARTYCLWSGASLARRAAILNINHPTR